MISEKREVQTMSFCCETSRKPRYALITVILIALAGPLAAAGIQVTAGDWRTTPLGPGDTDSTPKVAEFGDEVVLKVLDERVTTGAGGGSTNDPTPVDVALETVIDLTPYGLRAPGWLMRFRADLPVPPPPR